MFSLKQLEDGLRANIADIQKSFINKYIPADPSHTPDLYQHDVKAYCILSHAIFEEFIEIVSLEVMKNITGIWLTSRQSSDALLALCIFYNVGLKSEESEDEVQDRTFDALRKVIDRAKEAHSRAVFNNQGFSLKYLRNILTPVAIDVTSDAKYTSSLRTLADARGSFAHTMAKSAFFTDSKRATKPMTPETARDVVGDCIELCLNISQDARKFLPASG
jgi:RiboL-PSP-HEPN